MATKKGTYNLYTWENFDYSEFIKKYRSICANWKEDNDEDPFKCEEQNGLLNIKFSPSPKNTVTLSALKNDNRIIQKCKYLQHSIIVSVHAKAYSGDKESHHIINLNTSISVDVIGKDFYPMRKALMEMGYIQIHYVRNVQRYTPFSYSTTYKVKECPIKKEQTIDKTIYKYICSVKEELNRRRDKYLRIATLNVEKKEDFIKNYTLSLNKINIKDKKKFNEELTKYNYPNIHIYNNYIINSFTKEREIYKIDYKNNRIYHVLSNLKKEYKKYLNIKYSIDSKNSHPLLFCYFLYNYHNISIETSYYISQIFYLIYHKYNINISNPSINYHYDGKKLRNVLIENGIEESEIADVNPNEWEYIFLATNGLLWDNILSYVINEREDITNMILKENPELINMEDEQRTSKLRSIIKVQMFAEVFYSHSGYLMKDDNGEDVKPLARYFMECYPSVYGILSKFKNLKKCKDKKIFDCLSLIHLDYIENPHGILPNAMMQLESSIFCRALDLLYKKRYRAVNIHDAIVVPDVKNAPSVEVVEEVLKQCYAENGLCPTFAIDYYNK